MVGLNDERNDGAAQAEARLRALLRSMPQSAAAPEFRARLRREFASGTLAARRRRSRWPLLAAAALVPALAALLLWLGRAPAWELVALRGGGEVVVDGHVFAAARTGAIAARLVPGARVELRGGIELELQAAGSLSLQLVPGAEMTLPRPPGRGLPRRVVARHWNGEVRLVTGPRFRGAVLRILTPEADIEVRGTTLAVIRDAASTCVCNFDGDVRMAPIDGMPQEVPPGKRRFMYGDGRPPVLLDIDAMETMKLQMFHDSATPRLAAPGAGGEVLE
jgi:ferric-dicitrate binding protein FerR (iron transport regulator)